MTNLIVASFMNEKNAIEAKHKLSQLENYGDISIYGNAMVRTREAGKHEILEEDNHNGWRTLAGMGIGSLLGAFGGPVGFVIGLTTGTTLGMISDISRQSFDETFLEKVEKKMPAGTVSIVAEVDEDSEIFIDNALKPLGAEINRSDVDYEFEGYAMDKMDEIDNDLSEAREKMKTAVGNEKEKISKKITELKDKRKALIANARNDMKNFKNQVSSDVANLKADFIKDRIARYEDKLNKLNAELKVLNEYER
jgi:uncharacterized membrane protein